MEAGLLAGTAGEQEGAPPGRRPGFRLSERDSGEQNVRVCDDLPCSRQDRLRPRWCAIAVWLALDVTLFSAGSAHAGAPADVLKAYLGALYAHDSRAAYRLISRADQALKGEADYVREHPDFPGAALEIATALASQIRYERLRTEIEGNRATVTFEALVPDANDPAIDALVLGFDANRLAALSPEGRRRIKQELDERRRAGRLPVAVGDAERWELVREQGAWRVFLNWARALLIRFAADVKAGLPWAFAAIQPIVRATPGEGVRTAYRITNLSDRSITAKARDSVEPPDAARYLDVITCFCFIEQTLAPGESRELPVVFRVAEDVPNAVREISLRYEFYPVERVSAGYR